MKPSQKSQVLSQSPETNLTNLGIHLKKPPTPIGTFCNAKQVGDLLFVSGQGPVDERGTLRTGKVGDDVDLAAACAHARLVAINILATVKTFCGSLDHVDGVVKLMGLVNATSDFTEHPKIIDEASRLMCDIFGPAGVHTRTSYGVGSLPNNITVEIDAIFALRRD
ncbi:MAG: RidA family protein [Pseudomonadota bacterium]